MVLSADRLEGLARALDRYRAAFDDAAVRAALMSGGGEAAGTGPEADTLEPGLRELAGAFAEAVADRAEADPGPWWELSLGLSGVSVLRAPAGDPAERLAVCGALALAAVASLFDAYLDDTMPVLQGLADDPRPRVRAAAAVALGRLVLSRREATLAWLSRWAERGSVRMRVAALRAVTMDVALAVPALRGAALAFLDVILDRLADGGWGPAASAVALRSAVARALRALAPFEPEAVFSALDRLLVSAGPTVRGETRALVRSVVSYPAVVRRYPRQAAWLARRARG
jgi:hypothetical protein